MNIRWIGPVAVCICILAACAHPSAARLNEGKFVPFSEVACNLDIKQVKVHQVVKGDTLYKIARDNNVGLQELMQANNLNEKTILKIGTAITIPSVQGALHIVAPGETLVGLADRYQISRRAMLEANWDKEPSSLEIGVVVHIPDGSKQLAAVGAQPSRGDSPSDTLQWPIKGIITSGFGQRKSGFHHGLDIANDMGTAICAAASGTVSFVGSKPVYGRTVIIDHADGKQTLYAHAKTIYVDKGEQVSAGQKIAAVGVSGVTTGPHLHFEVRVDNEARNPLDYLPR